MSMNVVGTSNACVAVERESSHLAHVVHEHLLAGANAEGESGVGVADGEVRIKVARIVNHFVPRRAASSAAAGE